MDFEKEFNELKAKMTPKNTLKFLTGTLISLGAAAAVMATMKSPIRAAKGITKLLMTLGAFVLGCKAGDVAETYFNDTVDQVENAFKEGMKESGVKDGRTSE